MDSGGSFSSELHEYSNHSKPQTFITILSQIAFRLPSLLFDLNQSFNSLLLADALFFFILFVIDDF